MPNQISKHQHRTTYADCSVGNHIYYARYLDLLEAARGEFFRQQSVPFLAWQEQGLIFPVIECHLRYKRPARYDDLLTIEVWVTELGRVRLHFAYRITNQHGQLLIEAETHHVCATIEEKPRRAPEELVKALAPFLAEAAVQSGKQ